MAIKKRIIFGPWIGELGWELNSWQGWVRKACQDEYKTHVPYVISYPGRECLYQGVPGLRFLSHPDWFCDIEYSARAYATDYWTKEGPKIREQKNYAGPLMRKNAKKLLHHFREKLAITDDDISIIPWQPFGYKGAIYGGITGGGHIPKEIPKAEQSLIPIKPSPEMVEFLSQEMREKDFDPSKRLVLFFPRARVRNAARNWPERYYVKLARMIQRQFPKLTPAFVGSPDGALFKEGMPEGVLDLIRLNNAKNMLNIHIAAMDRAAVGIGPSSGILHLAAYAKMPFICNIDAKTHAKYPRRFTLDHNPFRSPANMIVGDQPIGVIRTSLREFVDAVYSG